MNRKIIYKQLLSAVLWMFSISIVTAVHASNMLEDISFASIPGDKIQVTLQFSEPAVEPGSFTIDSPARISLDFPDTGLALKNKRQTIGIGLARSITAVSAGNRTRVVLNLTSLTKYSTAVEGNKVVVTLDEANTSASTASLSHNTIENIDFRLGEEGEGNVVIYFNKQPESVNLKQQGDRLVLDIKDAGLPGNLERRLDVTDFKTPVTFVDTFSKGQNTKMVVETRGEFDHLGYQAGNTFVIEVKELTKAQKKAKEKAKFGYTGERLSLNFQDIEVRAVLQLIADFTGKNMVTSDTVTGSITLRLKNVPWDQALAIILKTKGLGMREEGNVMRVAPAEELAAIEKQELEAKKQIAELLPLVTETIQLQFVTASTVEKLLKKSRQQALTSARRGGRGGRGGSYNTDTVNPDNPDDEEGASYFSSRGTIMSDDRTNKLIIRDTARNIAQLRKLVAEIDTPTKQVLIDARIVAASNSFNKDMGLSWNFASVGNNGVVKTRGDLTPGTTNTAQTSQGGVDLGAAQKNLLGVTFALLNSDYLVDLEISASQIEGSGEVISSPRVVTTNGQSAVIKAGDEIPYQTASQNGTNTQFKEAVLSLEVTPLIIPGDKVNMDLNIKKDNVAKDVSTGIGQAPSIQTRSIETNVLVDNGDTVVLGGIFEHEKSKLKDSVPILGDIPVIGAAFRVNSTSDDKRELLIFITPKIMNENLTVR